MAQDIHQKIKDEMWASIRSIYPKGVPEELARNIDNEMTMASRIEALDGKGTALNTLHTIWKTSRGVKGNRNRSNSWVAYAIGLTEKMPSGTPLPLRRAFARAGFPDVDSDFEDERREEVVTHIVNTYGRDNVGNVGTYGAMHMKSAVRSLAKVIDAGCAFYKGKDVYKTENKIRADEIIASLPKPMGNKIIWTDETGRTHEIKSVKDAYEWVPEFRKYMDKYPEIMRHCKHVEGVLGNFSTHASGILVSNAPLSGLAPMRPVEKKNWCGDKVPSFSTLFAYEDCETIGLIKFDVLAIKMLSIVKHACRLIKDRCDIDLDIENLPLDDRRTLDIFRAGKTTGVFQMESYGMQKTCREIDIDRFDDIVATISLYRPGPMVSIPEYVARKKGLKRVEYFHPTIEPYVKEFLQDTYGVLCFQEQVMQICHKLAGFSMSEAYQVIKAVGKKKMDLMQKYCEQFVAGCMEKGVPEDVARAFFGHVDKDGNLFGFIVPFANYGFNRSHSLCYGYNAWITGYLKANFKEEFFTASLNAEAYRKKWDKVLILERDADRNFKINFLPRDINKCKLDYEIVRVSGQGRSEIRPSILCQGLSMAAGESIVANAPYKGMRDFAARTNRNVDTSSVAALAAAGFFPKGKGEQMVREFEAIRTDLKKAAKKGVQSMDMFDDMDNQ